MTLGSLHPAGKMSRDGVPGPHYSIKREDLASSLRGAAGHACFKGYKRRLYRLPERLASR